MRSLDAHLERIGEVMGGAGIQSFETNTDGLENDIVIVNGQWVFRFPKTDDGRGRVA